MTVIDVGMLREKANWFGSRADEIQSRTAAIASRAEGLAAEGVWDDERYRDFLEKFDDRTVRIKRLGERMEDIAEVLRSLANHVEQGHGEDLNVS